MPPVRERVALDDPQRADAAAATSDRGRRVAPRSPRSCGHAPLVERAHAPPAAGGDDTRPGNATCPTTEPADVDEPVVAAPAQLDRRATAATATPPARSQSGRLADREERAREQEQREHPMRMMTANGMSLSCVDRVRRERRPRTPTRRAPRPGSRARPTPTARRRATAATIRNTVAENSDAQAASTRRARRTRRPRRPAWPPRRGTCASTSCRRSPARATRPPPASWRSRPSGPGATNIEVVDARRRRPMPLSTRPPSPRPIAARNSSGETTSLEHRRPPQPPPRRPTRCSTTRSDGRRGHVSPPACGR